MIITDASAIISICDKGQGKIHNECVRYIKNVDDEFVTTMPCLTEAMYFLGKIAGWNGQQAVWNLIENLPFSIHHPEIVELMRIRNLMRKYKDTPMDFADASLVAAAENIGTRTVFTLDKDFLIYRMNEIDSFQIVP